MIDFVLAMWIFAQAAQSVPPMIASNVITAVLTAPATVALVRYLDNRAKQREVNERATIDASHALKLDDGATRRAIEEEVTGRHAIDEPIAERFAMAERAERQQALALVRELDGKLASANEQIAVLRTEVAALMSQLRVQAEALLKAHADNEHLLDYIDEKLPGKAPRPAELPSGIEVIRAHRVDPRREP